MSLVRSFHLSSQKRTVQFILPKAILIGGLSFVLSCSHNPNLAEKLNSNLNQSDVVTREEVVGKARDLIVPILGASKCDALIEKLLNLENVKDVRELRPLLQRV